MGNKWLKWGHSRTEPQGAFYKSIFLFFLKLSYIKMFFNKIIFILFLIFFYYISRKILFLIDLH